MIGQQPWPLLPPLLILHQPFRYLLPPGMFYIFTHPDVVLREDGANTRLFLSHPLLFIREHRLVIIYRWQLE